MEKTVALITVIIPTQNRHKDLYRCLLGLADNNLSLLKEVIIVDDGSLLPIDIDKEFKNINIRVIRNQKPLGAAVSRNIASQEVTSEIIAFLDDDAIPCPDWLLTIAQQLNPDRGGITGRVLRYDKGFVSKARQARYDKRYSSLGHGEIVNFFSGGNSAVWTHLFIRAGGFNNHGSGGDNSLVSDLAIHGYKVHFIPELSILHRNSKGLKKAFIEAYKSGLQHSSKMKLLEGINNALDIKKNAAGSEKLVVILNWFLNIVHISGRLQRRK